MGRKKEEEEEAAASSRTTDGQLPELPRINTELMTPPGLSPPLPPKEKKGSVFEVYGYFTGSNNAK